MKIYLNALSAIQFDKRIARAVILHALTVETSLMKVSKTFSLHVFHSIIAVMTLNCFAPTLPATAVSPTFCISSTISSSLCTTLLLDIAAHEVAPADQDAPNICATVHVEE